jgi:hypothetical protein
MKSRIDLKSAALGLGIGVLAMLAIAAGEKPQSQIGRYQLGGNQVGPTLLIDTVTGQVWGTSITTAQLRNDSDFFTRKDQ